MIPTNCLEKCRWGSNISSLPFFLLFHISTHKTHAQTFPIFQVRVHKWTGLAPLFLLVDSNLLPCQECQISEKRYQSQASFYDLNLMCEGEFVSFVCRSSNLFWTFLQSGNEETLLSSYSVFSFVLGCNIWSGRSNFFSGREKKTLISWYFIVCTWRSLTHKFIVCNCVISRWEIEVMFSEKNQNFMFPFLKDTQHTKITSRKWEPKCHDLSYLLTARVAKSRKNPFLRYCS